MHSYQPFVPPPQPTICQFTLAIEYRNPKVTMELVRAGQLPNEDPNILFSKAETHIHTMQTSCEAAFAVPHFQDVVIADVVRTFSETADPSDETAFRTLINTVVITLFAKHGALGLCALSEIRLQLNDVGHLSAWNPDNHAILLQSRASAFSAYFYQKHYDAYKIIALVTVGGEPVVPPINEEIVKAQSEVSMDSEGNIVVDNTAATFSGNGSVDDREDTPTGAEVAELTGSPHKATETTEPEAPATQRDSPPKLPVPDPADGKDRRNFRNTNTVIEPSVGTSVPHTFSRFGRDFSPATQARISDRTLSILGFGDVSGYRDVLLKICTGSMPLLAKPCVGEYSASAHNNHSRQEVPSSSFADARGVVMVPGGRRDATVAVPDGLKNMLQIYVNDPQKLNTDPLERTTAYSKIEETKKAAMAAWPQRKVVALHIRSSLSSSVVVVEFSRKQEANDFKRYLEAFQKFPFLNVFKIQPARQLISDVSQFVVPNKTDIHELEKKIHPEEVTIDHVLSTVQGLISKRTPLSSNRSAHSMETPGATDPGTSLESTPQSTTNTSRTTPQTLLAGTPKATLPSHIFGSVRLVIGNDESAKKYSLGDQQDVMLQMFEVLLSNAGNGPGSAANLFHTFICSPLATAITQGISHLGGPTRKLGEEANDAVDFKSLEAVLLRLQSEALGTAQIKNPTNTVTEVDRVFTESMSAIETMTKAATLKQATKNDFEASEIILSEGIPLESSKGSWTVVAGKKPNRPSREKTEVVTKDTALAQLQTLVGTDRKLLLSLEGSLLAVAMYLSPLAIYTRTFLCDMGVCKSRTLGRINRGLTRLCTSKAMSLMDGLISAATTSVPIPQPLLTSVMEDMGKSPAKLQVLQQRVVSDCRTLDFSIANVYLEMGLLFATVASNWEALFEKAEHMSKIPEHRDRWLIGEPDKAHIDVRPLYDQALRLVQVAVGRLIKHTEPGHESELTRALFITVCQRAKHYSYHSSSKSHWPLSLKWCNLNEAEGASGSNLLPLALRRELEGIDDDYQSIVFRSFVVMR